MRVAEDVPEKSTRRLSTLILDDDLIKKEGFKRDEDNLGSEFKSLLLNKAKDQSGMSKSMMVLMKDMF